MSQSDRQKIVQVKIEDELKVSYLDYAMSSILARALPDVRDGLKPSQRRILVAMNDLSLAPNRGFRKCAKIAGDTSGNYHPHGEAIVYPTLVHLAQPFRLRYPLVQGQGNFGSIDGYPPAAMRYTEARLSWPSMAMLDDLEKDTVNLAANYDETRSEPQVLPAKFPNLLCNGSMGIAVGMATKIPPHNLREIAQGLNALIDNPDISVDELMEYVKAPDFPTGGVIYGMSGVRQAYRTGRGTVQVRARAEVETQSNGRERIVVTEIPFLVNKSTLLERIAELVRSKVIDGISNIRDESGRKGLRIVFDIKKEAYAEVVLNQLYQHSMLQNTFGIMLLAIVNSRPELNTLKDMLRHYVDHRHEVILRRTRFELGKAAARAHILEALRIALDNIDEVIRIIRASKNPEAARDSLMEAFDLSETQSQAILSMPLQRLTSLEHEKIVIEYRSVVEQIEELTGILTNRDRQLTIIKDEIADVNQRFGDDRRTELVYSADEFDMESLIANEDMVVTISRAGYIKRMSPRAYRVQQRGGRGITGMKTRDEDLVEHLFIASSHAYLLFLTTEGKCHWLKVYRIPEGDRTSRGRPVVNLLQLGPEDTIAAVVPVAEFDADHFLFTATRNGVVKRTVLSAYQNVRRDGIIALNILEGDQLIGAAITDGKRDIGMVTSNGYMMRFAEEEVRPVGRVATGVKGMDLRQSDHVVAMVIVDDDDSLLTICEYGYGKRTAQHCYPAKHRGGLGVIDIKANARNGRVVDCKAVKDGDEIMVITQRGIVIRMPVSDVSQVGRNTQGVRVINLDDGDQVIAMTRVDAQEEEIIEAAEEASEPLAIDKDTEDSASSLANAEADSEITDPVVDPDIGTETENGELEE